MASNSVSSINVVAGLSFAGFLTSFNKMISTTKKKGSEWSSVLKQNSTLIAGSLVGIGAASVRMAATFETSLTKMRTLVGVSAKDVDGFKGKILELSGKTGKSAVELADALYYITSSGLSGSKALDALTESAKASAIGMGETSQIADVLTSVMNAYGHETYTASEVTNLLLKTVKVGKIEADALAGSIGRVIPEAVSMGVSFQEVGAALATMSLSGKDAEESTTALKSILNSLLSPSKQAADELKTLGYTTAGLRNEIKEKGLLAVLVDLKTKLDGNQDATGKLFANVRALGGFLALTGSQMNTYNTILDEMNVKTNDVNKAMEIFNETTAARAARVSARFSEAMIVMGDALIYALDALSDPQTIFKSYANSIISTRLEAEKLTQEARLMWATLGQQPVPLFNAGILPQSRGTTPTLETITPEATTRGKNQTEFSRIGMRGVNRPDADSTKFLLETKETEKALKGVDEEWQKVNHEMEKAVLLGGGYADELKKADIEAHKLARTMNTVGKAGDLAMNLVGGAVQLMSEDSSDNTSQIESDYAAQVDAINNRYEAEKQAARGSSEAINSIEKDRVMKLQQAEAELDSARKDSAQKQFRRQQELQIAEANMNGALAITQIWADSSLDLYSKIGWTAGMAAMTAEQVALIESQSPPAYALGTSFHAGGLAVVGENGPELVNLPTGSSVMSNTQMRQQGSGIQAVSLTPNEVMVWITDQMQKRKFRTG